jgi:GxxExxY protein
MARMRAQLDPSIEGVTEKIIGAAFAVSNKLGHGFLEQVYKHALTEEFKMKGVAFTLEKPYPIPYHDKIIGKYIADLVVEDKVIVELKAVENVVRAHAAQLLNYLKASRLPVGLLINFGTPRVQIKRMLLGPSAGIRPNPLNLS